MLLKPTADSSGCRFHHAFVMTSEARHLFFAYSLISRRSDKNRSLAPNSGARDDKTYFLASARGAKGARLYC